MLKIIKFVNLMYDCMYCYFLFVYIKVCYIIRMYLNVIIKLTRSNLFNGKIIICFSL